MRHFFTRYHPRYVRSLVYMMQASEYSVRDFLRWLWRTRDFLRVEQRKSLVKTRKSLLFLTVGYSLLFILNAGAILLLFAGGVWLKYILFLLVVAITPFVLAYCLVGLLFISNLIQKPIEYVIMRRAKKKLASHPGLKIAIAGSFGKTSMREILKVVLGAGLPAAQGTAQAGKKVAAPPGSHNTPLGISRFIQALKGDEEVLIFEMGEYYPGDIKRLCKLVQPDVGVITGINEAHLERFRDIERTRKTIFELADYLQGESLYINGENALARKYTRARDIVYSRAGAGEWKVEGADTSLNGTSFTLRNGSRVIHARSNLLGLHQVGSLLVSADIASKLGFSAGQIEKGISKTRPFDHRLQPTTDALGVTVLDDSYNGNPDGVRAVIEFLSSIKGRRRWYVTPGLVEMGERKEEVHKEIGREITQAGIEKVILIRNSVTPFIEMGLQEGKYRGEVMWFDKALDAFSALQSLTLKGDVVLLQNDWPDQYA